MMPHIPGLLAVSSFWVSQGKRRNVSLNFLHLWTIVQKGFLSDFEKLLYNFLLFLKQRCLVTLIAFTLKYLSFWLPWLNIY